MLPLAVLAAHRHQVDKHRRMMVGIFLGALVIAGLFTLLPGRIMHAAVFGPSTFEARRTKRAPHASG